MGDPAQPSTAAVTATPGEQAEHGTNEGHVGDTYEVPTYEAHSSFAALKDRIRHHYELASDYYYSLW
jgi:tocopherol O-methyltransferase